MPGGCPDEAARLVEGRDTDDVAALRAEAGRLVADARGGAAYLDRECPAPLVDDLLRGALGGEDGALGVVGTLDGMVVGFLFAWYDPKRPPASRVARVVALWVTPQARGLGVGEAMMGELVTRARQAECGSIDADALPGDRDTKNYFETHGLVARLIRVSRDL